MRWFERLERFIAKHWPDRVRDIPDHLNPSLVYMTRTYLIGGRGHRFFTLALHHVHMSDADGWHDHPFGYGSLILAGGYVEDTPHGATVRRPGHFRIRSGRSFHRLILRDPVGGAWSLFAMGPRYRNWGFLVNGRWISHQEHLGALANV